MRPASQLKPLCEPKGYHVTVLHGQAELQTVNLKVAQVQLKQIESVRSSSVIRAQAHNYKQLVLINTDWR